MSVERVREASTQADMYYDITYQVTDQKRKSKTGKSQKKAHARSLTSHAQRV